MSSRFAVKVKAIRRTRRGGAEGVHATVEIEEVSENGGTVISSLIQIPVAADAGLSLRDIERAVLARAARFLRETAALTEQQLEALASETLAEFDRWEPVPTPEA